MGRGARGDQPDVREQGVGQAIRDCWKGKREDLFVMTKIPGGLNASEVRRPRANRLLRNFDDP